MELFFSIFFELGKPNYLNDTCYSKSIEQVRRLNKLASPNLIND